MIFSKYMKKTVTYFGTYESNYPRNRQIIDYLNKNENIVNICHVAICEKCNSKLGNLFRINAFIHLILKYGYGYILLLVKYLRKHIKSNELFVGYIGQLDVIVIWPFTRIFKQKLVFNTLISLHDTLVNDRRLFRPNSIIAKALWILDWLSYHLSDEIIIDTYAQKDFLKKTFSLKTKKISVIPVRAESIFQPIKPNIQFQNSNKFLLLFYGKFTPLHGIDVILSAMKILQDKGLDDIQLLLIGSGQCDGDMRKLSEELLLKNTKWIEWIEYEDLPHMICNSNLCLGVFGPSNKAKRVIPNKVVQVLQCGKKIITQNVLYQIDRPLDRNLIEIEPTPFLLANAIEKEYKNNVINFSPKF